MMTATMFYTVAAILICHGIVQAQRVNHIRGAGDHVALWLYGAWLVVKIVYQALASSRDCS